MGREGKMPLPIPIPETQQTSHVVWPSASTRHTGYLALERVDVRRMVRENTALQNQGIRERFPSIC